MGGINFCRKFPGTIFIKNMKIQINTLNFSCLYKVKKLINIGSACIYSDKNKTPFIESDFDKRAMHPSVLNYGYSKLTQIYGSLALSKEFGLNSINLLPANLYGPFDKFDADNSHVISAMIKKFSFAKKNKLNQVNFYGTGNTVREFLHVDDCAEAIVRAMEKYNSTEPLNLGTGQGIKIKKLANKISKLVEFDGKIYWDKKIEDGAKIKILSNLKMKKKLKWKPKIDLDKGLVNLIFNLKKRGFF